MSSLFNLWFQASLPKIIPYTRGLIDCIMHKRVIRTIDIAGTGF